MKEYTGNQKQYFNGSTQTSMWVFQQFEVFRECFVSQHPLGTKSQRECPSLLVHKLQKKSLSMMKTIPFRHGVPIPASIQHNHYLMNIVTNGTFPYHSMEKTHNTFTKFCLKVSLESIDGLQLVVVKEVYVQKNYPLPYHLIRLGQLYIAISLIKA